ncbi:TonB-dependent receptor plug domain-containing protein [Pseudoalteromonas sp. XMcav11-Q]|uniref:TonB-dependent receptor n=1 Tax=Pseudoalteromonas sp. XMcav11-Q TaxID=3136665 RepID=UPI0032C426A0
MRTRSVLNTRLTPLAFALGLSLSLPATAQSHVALYQFNLTQQPISHTLTQVAEAASMNLIADAKLLNGLQAPALKGEVSLTEALERTLKGSQLTASIIDNNIVIKAAINGSAPVKSKTNNTQEKAKHSQTPNPQDNIEVITVKGDKLNLNREQIARTKGLSNSDIFSTFSGIEANNIRNEAGALDIGIRGVQGEGRVPIFIDGSLQSTHTNRGYMGSSDRTYIDSNLISSVNVEKGASAKASPFGSGAIGGTVNIRTLGTQDILQDGKHFGALVKVNTHNNNKTPEVPESFGLQSYYEISNHNDTLDFAGGGFTLATAYQQDNLQAVLAYSKKKVGNYFAGKNSFDDFVETVEYVRWVPSTDHEGQYDEVTVVDQIPPPVNQNGEVVNTSFESDSYLAKLTYAFTDEQSLEVNTRYHKQEAGEMLATYWYKQRAGDTKFWKVIDENGQEQWMSEEIPEGVETMPQWAPGSALVNSASALYRFLPSNNSLVDLSVNVWRTSARLQQYNALGSNLGANAGQYFHRYNNKRHGISAFNTSALSLASTPITLTYGLSWQVEKLSPHKDWKDNFNRDWYPADFNLKATSRHGKQTKRALFANANIDLAPVEFALNVNLHDSVNEDYQTGEKLTFDAKADVTVQANYQLLDNTVIKAKYSNAYRMPNLYETTVSNEVFSYSSDYPITPEKTKSYDIGFESDFSNLLSHGDKLIISAEYFYTNIESMLATGFLPKPDAPSWDQKFTFTNYDKFELPGTEFGLHYQSDLFYSRLSYTKYTDVKMCSRLMAEAAGVDTCNTTGFAGSLTPLRVPPEKSYIATLGMTLFNDTIGTGFTYKKHAEKHHPGGFLAGTGVTALEYIPAGYQLDFYLDYIFSDSIKGNLAITNLTDQYKVSSGSIVAMPEPGQTISIGLEIKL